MMSKKGMKSHFVLALVWDKDKIFKLLLRRKSFSKLRLKKKNGVQYYQRAIGTELNLKFFAILFTRVIIAIFKNQIAKAEKIRK